MKTTGTRTHKAVERLLVNYEWDCWLSTPLWLGFAEHGWMSGKKTSSLGTFLIPPSSRRFFSSSKHCFHVVHCLFNYRDKLNRKFIRWHRVAFFKQQKRNFAQFLTFASCKCGVGGAFMDRRIFDHHTNTHVRGEGSFCVCAWLSGLFIEFLIPSNHPHAACSSALPCVLTHSRLAQTL